MNKKCANEYTLEQLNYGHKVWDFMRWSFFSFIISSLILILSIFFITLKGFKWGLDFSGGTVIEIALEKPINIEKLRLFLQQKGFSELLIQNFSSNHNIIIRALPTITNNRSLLSEEIISIINKTTKQNAEIKRLEYIGPNISTNLIQTSVMALLIALISIFIYISFRFEWRLATSIITALVHDIVITMGILSLFSIEIDFTIIASLMSIISYSLNDSIVVSDRIRENFRKTHLGTSYEILNISLTQTLNRTLISSGVILTVILVLYFFGGPVLKNFSLTMLIGVSIGTISSIYVASAIALKLGIEREHFLKNII